MSTFRGDLPLVDRRSELAVLRSRVEGARHGMGGALLVVGAAGIGKTRLAKEALRIGRDAGLRCAWGAGWKEAGVAPLWPWSSVLEQLGWHGALTPDASRPDTEMERFATFQSVADAIATTSASAPLLIVIDDAHDADRAALLLTRFVIRTLSALPVLVMVTARDTADVDLGVRSALDDLAHDATLVRPATLTTVGLDALLRRAGRSASHTDLIEILELTGGNPLLVAELLAAEVPLHQVTVSSIRTTLHTRLGGLSDDVLSLLVVVAMLGPLAQIPVVLDVAAIDTTTARRHLDAAQLAGIIEVVDDDCHFVHRLLAEALLSTQGDDELARLHARIADVLDRADWKPVEHVVAVAHHRLAAASFRRDSASALDASQACRRAARPLVAGVAYEEASGLLERAVEAHERAGVPVPTMLLVDVAHTKLSAGDLRSARSWFHRAAEQATEASETAEAAVGLGGIWVREHRTRSEHAAYMALLDTALERLGTGHTSLAVRLRVRRAAERIYTDDGSKEDLEDAVRAARECGEPRVLAEALSLWHHTMLGPANTGRERLMVADELVSTAAVAGDEMLGLMGVLWRAVDLLLLGDARADRALLEVRERADALQVAAVLFVLDAIEVMRQLRDGRLDDAEQAAQRCFDAGVSIGDADAVGYFGGHLLTIRWLQLRPEEILPLAREVARSPTLVDGDVAPLAASAVLAALLDDTEQAAVDLHEVMARITQRVETSSNWLITMFCAAEAAHLLQDRDTAKAVYDSLLPYRHLPMMGSLGIVCMGSAERSLGLAASTLGDPPLAVHHFELAVEHNLRLEQRVMTAISEGDLGTALIRRGRHGDLAAGCKHVDRAVNALTAFGLDARAEALRKSVEGLTLDAPLLNGELVRSDSTWRLIYDEHVVEIADSVGVRRLCQLLQHPWTDIAAADLVGQASPVTRHDVNDMAALSAYRSRIDELRADIAQADEDNDSERASQRRNELHDLLDVVSTAIGLSGKSRAFTDTTERARVAVRKSLSRVFDAIDEQDPDVARDLRESMHTGAICTFRPAHRFPVVWRVSTSHPAPDIA